ncbi:bile acid:sodium symporter family protein [Collinsella sp. AGMB00827]|uniref:Bile acid:sodium symporter family protein n=2 Tax=Collinsella ureilytica TaxID=2869515 RepID=A0ABS7MM07_9ACTN|nr:bile acid:sodium symporter family protein [Collinsella urealyticum]
MHVVEVAVNTWIRFGKRMGELMPILVFGCVATGVLMPHVFSKLIPFVPGLFAFMTFQGSLSNTSHQLVETLRDPAELIVIVTISLVLMPTGASLLAKLFFANHPHLITGMVLAYCVPVGIVSFMWVDIFHGRTSLALAAVLASTLIAPFTIPFSLSLLLGEAVQIDALSMVGEMVPMIALPAIAGTLVNDLSRGWGHERLSPILGPASRIFMLLVICANSTSMSDYVVHMTWERVQVALFILSFSASGFFWGALAARIMGRSLPVLVTMSFDCGLRNISAGAVIAVSHFPGEAVFPVMCGTIFQQILASVAGRILQRLGNEERERQNRVFEAGRAAWRRIRTSRTR